MYNTIMFKKRKLLSSIKKYSNSRQAIVITGFRRTGKTTILAHLYESVKSSNKIYLDLEQGSSRILFQEQNYENIVRALEGRKLNIKEQSYIFLDEIQLVSNITSVIKYLYDHYPIKFYLTGSSSFYLRGQFSESMAGRKFVFNLYPLDFEEFLAFKGEELNMFSLSKAGVETYYLQLGNLYNEYLNYGGFPEVVLAQSFQEKNRLLDDILESYFKLDVQQLANFRDNSNLRKLLYLLPARVCSKIDMGKLSQSIGVTRQTLDSYITFFAQTFLINLVSPISGSRDVEIKHKPKLYFIDSGLLNRIGKVTIASIFENMIFHQLKARLEYIDQESSDIVSKIGYYATKQGAEIDFVYNRHTAYEVKVSAGMRDVVNLRNRSNNINIKNYLVVSLEKFNPISNVVSPFFLNTD